MPYRQTEVPIDPEDRRLDQPPLGYRPPTTAEHIGCDGCAHLCYGQPENLYLCAREPESYRTAQHERRHGECGAKGKFYVLR